MELMKLSPKLSACLLSCLDDHRQLFNAYEIFGYPEDVEVIPHKSCDGFIPYTNGGYALSFMSDLSLAWGSGSHSKVVAPFIKSSLEDSLKWFKSENPTFDETNENDHLWDAYNKYEYEWMSESSAFWYQLRVIFFSANNCRNLTGEDEIYIISGTNTDFSYGRDAGLQIAYEKTLKIVGLTCKRLQETIQDAINAI